MKTLIKTYKAMLPISNLLKKLQAENPNNVYVIEEEGPEQFSLYQIEETTMTTSTETVETTETAENIQNGVKRPASNTKAGQIWDLADNLSAQIQAPVSFNELIKGVVEHNYNPSTAFSEYTKWRKFHGISGAVVDPEIKAEREAKKAEAEKRKALREAAKANRIEQNGVKRPNPETKALAIWELADSLSAAKGEPVTTDEMVEAGEKVGINKNSVTSELYFWRKFHGLTAARVVTKESLEAKLSKAIAEVDRIQKQLAEMTNQEQAA